MSPDSAVVLAGLCLAGAVLVWPRGQAGRRVRHLTGGGRRAGADWVGPVAPLSPSRGLVPAGPRGWVQSPWTAGVVAAAAVWLLVGGPVGIGLGFLIVVVVPRWLGRLEPAGVRADRRQLATDLPLAVDLLAACLTVGAVPSRGLASVAEAVGGPVGHHLERVAAALRLGADPAAAWGPLSAHPALGPLARTVVRSLDTGAPMGPTLDRAARDLRARRRCEVEAVARSVAVHAVAPLGLCFLPAFVLLGIVPTVWGMAAGLLSGRGP